MSRDSSKSFSNAKCSSKPRMQKPSLSLKTQKELTLSAQALALLLEAFRERGVSLRFKAKGFSMSPFIKNGDVITISPLNNKPPRLGDIIAFSDPTTHKVRVHRVIKKKNTSCLVKGDNTAWRDGYVEQTNILGYVHKVEREGKRIFLGRGPERYLIALFSSNRMFYSLLEKTRKIVNLIKNKQHG